MLTEYARTYLPTLNRPYNQQDLAIMGKNQLKIHLDNMGKSNFVFADTDALTIKIWSETKYGTVDKNLDSYITFEHVGVYLLCMPDLVWEYDIMRENPHDQIKIAQKHLLAITNLKKPFYFITGVGEQRFYHAVFCLNSFIQKNSYF